MLAGTCGRAVALGLAAARHAPLFWRWAWWNLCAAATAAGGLSDGPLLRHYYHLLPRCACCVPTSVRLAVSGTAAARFAPPVPLCALAARATSAACAVPLRGFTLPLLCNCLCRRLQERYSYCSRHRYSLDRYLPTLPATALHTYLWSWHYLSPLPHASPAPPLRAQDSGTISGAIFLSSGISFSLFVLCWTFFWTSPTGLFLCSSLCQTTHLPPALPLAGLHTNWAGDTACRLTSLYPPPYYFSCLLYLLSVFSTAACAIYTFCLPASVPTALPRQRDVCTARRGAWAPRNLPVDWQRLQAGRGRVRANLRARCTFYSPLFARVAAQRFCRCRVHYAWLRGKALGGRGSLFSCAACCLSTPGCYLLRTTGVTYLLPPCHYASLPLSSAEERYFHYLL